MGRAEFQAKKGKSGDKLGRDTSTFNSESGRQTWGSKSVQSEWQGTTKGDTTHKKSK